MAKLSRSLALLVLLTLGSQASISAASLPTNIDKLDLPLQVAQANQNIIYVAPNGTDSSGAGTQALPFRTITAALQTAPTSGTVIQLAPGTYSAETGEVFPLKLTPGIKLRGNENSSGNGVLVKGGGVFVSQTFARQNVGILAADNSQISGITLTNSNPRGYGLWLESKQNVTISNNTFINNTHDGVFLTGETIASILNNVFTKNKGSGISAVGSSAGDIRSNTFENTGFGLSIGQKSQVVVSNNRISNNRNAIIISNLAAPTLRANVLENSEEYGLVILKDRKGQPNPNLGTTDNPGLNTFKNNKLSDINNASGVTLVAVGNQVDKKRVIGSVELIASNVPIPPAPTTPNPTTPGSLRDISGHWAERYISVLTQRGVITGFQDGTYRPDEFVTRAQYAAILNSAFPQKTAIRANSNFKDVPSNFWAANAIKQASEKGFISGFPNQTFRPQERVTRVQVLTSLVNGWQLLGGDNVNLPTLYKDAAEIPSYAVKAIATATSNKLVLNYPDTRLLAPNRPATRAEVAAIVYQTMVNRGQVAAIPSNYVAGE